MATPREVLEDALQRASDSIDKPLVADQAIRSRIEVVTRNLQNRALARLLLAAGLAKAYNPKVDIRKPYTEIGDTDAYSGRTYDEAYVTGFVIAHELPCNPTTAFLTPALRNRNATLTSDLEMVGRPPSVYKAALELLTDVHEGRIRAEDLLAETVRCLLIDRDAKRERMKSLLAGLRASEEGVPLSAEAIVTLIEQHLRCRNASRLPVLVVAAAYHSAGELLGEKALPLAGHNAADKQTGAVGDVQITLVNENDVVAGYEMKMKRVTRNDIDLALPKILDKGIQHYVFITTDVIEVDVSEYAANMYEATGGTEIVVLDCIGFLRHFLHLFHRFRAQYVEAYQELLLAEPDSAVSQPLKEAFLALRQAAEAGTANGIAAQDMTGAAGIEELAE